MVEPGWQAVVTGRGDLLLSRVAAPAGRADVGHRRADPVMLEIFNNLFMSVAEQMGVRAAGHRALGQHQGAARLLLRALRRPTAA